MNNYTYEVTFISKCYTENQKYYFLKDFYTKWFDKQVEAIKYAKRIKNKLKKEFKKIKDMNDNTIILEVNQYYYYPDIGDEVFKGNVYSLNILNKY